jgi:nitroreductase
MMIRTPRLERALELALRAPSVHNSQPWRWQLQGDVIKLFADFDRRLPANDPGGRDLLISCGAALHHFRVALGHEGHDAYVKYSPDLNDDSHLATITVSDAPPDPTTARLFNAIAHRHTERRRMSYRPVPKSLLATLAEAARRFGARVQPTYEAREAFAVAFAEATERERWTPSRTTELRIWSCDRTRSRVLAGSPAGLDPLPDDHPHDDAAEFLLLTTAEDRTYDRLRVGEALSSLLLTATNAGLATMPISLDPRGAVFRLAEARSEHQQIVVRVGWPLADGADATRTRRRDLTSVLVPSAS